MSKRNERGATGILLSLAGRWGSEPTRGGQGMVAWCALGSFGGARVVGSRYRMGVIQIGNPIFVGEIMK